LHIALHVLGEMLPESAIIEREIERAREIERERERERKRERGATSRCFVVERLLYQQQQQQLPMLQRKF
jgi:hypothetical protein